MATPEFMINPAIFGFKPLHIFSEELYAKTVDSTPGMTQTESPQSNKNPGDTGDQKIVVSDQDFRKLTSEIFGLPSSNQHGGTAAVPNHLPPTGRDLMIVFTKMLEIMNEKNNP